MALLSDGPRTATVTAVTRTHTSRSAVYTEAITDADGAATPGGHPPTEVDVEFSEVDERTHVVLTHRGIPAGSPGEAGWRAALDQLDRRLATG